MKTTLMGLELSTPVIVAAGPWVRDGACIEKCFAAGAGAVITETIGTQMYMETRPRIAGNDMGVQNICLYSHLPMENWVDEIAIAKKSGGILIASVTASSPTELAYVAIKMEQAGADALELCLSCPQGETLEVVASSGEKVYQMTKEVVDHVKIPVMVKLSQNVSNISYVAKMAKKAGAAAVSAINTPRCILGVDIELGKPLLPTYGGYSGAAVKPLALASVATIAQTVDIPICGVGGISTAKDAIEYLMLGATAVQIGTAVILEGYEVITKVVEGISKWAEEHHVKHAKEIKGCALTGLQSFDEMTVDPLVCKIKRDESCEIGCTVCQKVCMYEAVECTDGVVEITSDRCTGCGVCVSLCPSQKLRLSW
ncbi:dihydroorotate dehydrogenase [Chakrabartyella piscis]|uniref:dihydroorotate dehydrogenase n=1 Tax=Chakrabartyella piscis TaxID=2918914 RepID=UPI002958C5A9|nr:tRNA-dihydrouridine synthase [Chakrabartyella piscis]